MNPNLLPELGRALRVLGEHGDAIGRDTPADKLHEIAADLERARELIRKIAGPKPLTDCSEHPFGAVDDEAPDRCLICHTRRRKAQSAAEKARPYGGYR